MQVYYSPAALALLDEMTERFRTEARQTGTHYVTPAHTPDGRTVSAIRVWRTTRYGDRLDMSFPASPCPRVAALNAYRYIRHQASGRSSSDFHAWDPYHVQALAN